MSEREPLLDESDTDSHPLSRIDSNPTDTDHTEDHTPSEDGDQLTDTSHGSENKSGSDIVLDTLPTSSNTVPLATHSPDSTSPLTVEEETISQDKERRKIVVGSSSNNNDRSHSLLLSSHLVKISRNLSKDQLCVFKIVISTLRGVNWSKLESLNEFTKVYRLLECSLPKQAVSITRYILDRLKSGINQEAIDFLISATNQSFRVKDHELFDYVLSLWEVVSRMSSEVYSGFIDCVKQSLLSDYHTDKLHDRVHLIQLLNEHGCLTQARLKSYFEWIVESGACGLLNHLKDFCARQGLAVPTGISEDHPPTVQPQSVPTYKEAKFYEKQPLLDQADSDPSSLTDGDQNLSPTTCGDQNLSPTTSGQDPSPTTGSKRVPYRTFNLNLAKDNRKCPCRKLTRRQMCCCIVSSAVMGVLCFLGFIVFLSYGSIYHDKYHDDSPMVYSVSSYAVTLLKCYDPTTVKSVSIVKGEPSQYYSTTFYTVRKDDLKTNASVLAKVNRTFCTFGKKNVALGYWKGDNPLYVAGKGNITYSFSSSNRSCSIPSIDSHSTVNSHTKTCDFQLFLFLSYKYYTSFTGSSDATPIKFEQNSTCFHIPRNQNTSGSITFSITDGGHFYVAGHLSADLFFNINITGNITVYDLSKATRVCSINKNNDQCEVDITGNGDDHPLCILSNSNSIMTDTRSINVTVTPVAFKKYDTRYLIGGIVFFVLFILFCICCGIFCCKFFCPC